MGTEQPVQTLRLGNAELEELIAQLERDGAMNTRGSRRESRRWRAQAQKTVVIVQDESGARRSLVMAPRNLSTGGIGLLNGGFLHAGGSCVVVLRDVRGKAVQVAGKIVRCTHLRGTVHDIGVQFDRPVNPRDFFIFAGNEYLFNAERVDPLRLTGRVLVIDDSRSDQRLISHLLRETALEFEYAMTGEEGLRMLDEHPSLALVDYVLPDMDGISLVQTARARGCVVPMILVSGQADHEVRYAAIAAGAKEMLFKPLDESLLMRAAAEYLLLRDIQARDEDPFRATAKGIGAEAIEACIEEVHELGVKLGGLLESGSLEQVAGALKHLHGMAADYGIKALHLRSGIALQKIAKIESAEEASFDVGRVVEACRMARGPMG